MKGIYCLVLELRSAKETRVGAMGIQKFLPGVYVYVGSARAGIEQRIRRHRSKAKKIRWHIDYLLEDAEVVATISIPSISKEMECQVASVVMSCEGAAMPVSRFGSSDCRCASHLFYFGDKELEDVMESVGVRLCMLAPPTFD